jgi:ankyrin repeat protein
LYRVFSSGDNLELVKEVIESGVDVNRKIRAPFSFHKFPPLYLVRSEMYYPHTARIAEYLLEEGANPNFTDTKGRTLLMHASGALNRWGTSVFTEPEFVELLLEYDAEINAISDEGMTALDYAVQDRELDIAELLLKNGAEVSSKTLSLAEEDKFDHGYIYRFTKLIFDAAVKQGVHYADDPLLEAAILGDSEKVVNIIDKMDVKEFNQHVPFYIAAYCSVDTLKRIEAEGFDLHTTSLEDEFSLLNMAAIGGNIAMTQYLIETGADIHHEVVSRDLVGTSLQAAVMYNHYEVASFLLSKGALFYIPDDWNMNSIDTPANEFEAAILTGNPEMLALLEQYNYPFNETNIYYATKKAIQFNQIDMLRTLLEKYIDPNYRNRQEGQSLLDICATYENLDAIRVLQEYGVIIATDNSDAIDHACDNGSYELVKFFLNNGMAADAKFALPDASKGAPGLMTAIDHGFFDIVKLLVENGANINATEESGGTTVTMHAARSSYHILQYLIDQGADIDVQNEKGVTALMCAVFFQYPKCVEVLLNAGADTTLKNNEGLTAKEIAKKTLNSDIIKLFQ